MRFSPECNFAMGGGGGKGGRPVPLANIEEDEEECGMYGFTASECEELLQQGRISAFLSVVNYLIFDHD